MLLPLYLTSKQRFSKSFQCVIESGFVFGALFCIIINLLCDKMWLLLLMFDITVGEELNCLSTVSNCDENMMMKLLYLENKLTNLTARVTELVAVVEL